MNRRPVTSSQHLRHSKCVKGLPNHIGFRVAQRGARTIQSVSCSLYLLDINYLLLISSVWGFLGKAFLRAGSSVPSFQKTPSSSTDFELKGFVFLDPYL